jgi:hypothetical protein
MKAMNQSRRNEARCRREQEEDHSAEKATENDQESRKTEIEIELNSIKNNCKMQEKSCAESSMKMNDPRRR